ncbi:MAG: SDR family oxidoreductase [Ferruginibacter sp.]|nr:SDR family oxidoreductase [Cytophagales bacterium]
MNRLHNEVAIVTGGMRGIGLAAARAFVQQGANVMLVDVDEAQLQQAVAELGKESTDYAVADVTQAEKVSAFVDKTVERFGKVSIFFSNAGVGGLAGPLWECSEEAFDRVIAVNLKGVWLGLKYVIPAMVQTGGGSIIITSSVAGLRGTRQGVAYAASKHAVIGVMKTAALEAARFNIRVNSIHPGPIETDMVRDLERSIRPDNLDEGKQLLLKSIPMRRYGTPEEVADLVVFLASNESRFITGAEHKIDGGLVAG